MEGLPRAAVLPKLVLEKKVSRRSRIQAIRTDSGMPSAGGSHCASSIRADRFARWHQAPRYTDPFGAWCAANGPHLPEAESMASRHAR
jgi:hypothetical protein